MKIFRILVAVVILAALSMPQASAETKAKTRTLRGNVTKGNIFFADFFSMGGEKCAAFLSDEEGNLICILDNEPAGKLKEELGGARAKVEVTGAVTKDAAGRYLKIKDYNVIEKKKSRNLGTKYTGGTAGGGEGY